MARGVFTAATAITAAGHNAVTDPPRCRVNDSNATTSITTSGTPQVVTFDTEVWDFGGLHSTSVNTGRITVPSDAGGTYDIGGHVQFAANATGYRELQLRVNGTTTIATNRVMNLGAGDATRVTIHTSYLLAVGDYVELLVVQSSGGALNYSGGLSYSPIFYAQWTAI